MKVLNVPKNINLHYLTCLVTPRPILCGKIVAFRTLLLPWTASIPYIIGISKGVDIDPIWKSFTMLIHASGDVSFAGGLAPPVNTLPIQNHIVI